MSQSAVQRTVQRTVQSSVQKKALARRACVAVALLAGGALLPGCRTTGQGAQTGTVLGALLGAGTGALIGHNHGSHNEAAYALGGAAIGALGGYFLGDQADHQRAGRAGPETIGGPGSFISDREPAYVVRERRVIRQAPACRERIVVREECDPYPPGW